jgi:hypothetical protein
MSDANSTTNHPCIFVQTPNANAQRRGATDGVREGEVGCLSDEIQNLVGPTECRTMNGPAGPRRGKDAGASPPESRLWAAVVERGQVAAIA